jgi:hypothetical protein
VRILPRSQPPDHDCNAPRLSGGDLRTPPEWFPECRMQNAIPECRMQANRSRVLIFLSRMLSPECILRMPDWINPRMLEWYSRKLVPECSREALVLEGGGCQSEASRGREDGLPDKALPDGNPDGRLNGRPGASAGRPTEASAAAWTLRSLCWCARLPKRMFSSKVLPSDAAMLGPVVACNESAARARLHRRRGCLMC